MGNEEFLEVHLRAHVIFVSYGRPDHSLVVLICPQSIKAKSRSFRFANYIANKDEFLGVIKDKWKTDVEGFAMYKLVKKLKAMKPAMNKLNWKNRYLFENVKKLKNRLDDIQTKIDAGPSNIYLIEKGVSLFKDYTMALEDEENLLLQKTKKIDNQEACKIIIEVSNEEIKDTMFDTDDKKAPGPDGFTAKFFKKSWEVIGKDVYKDVKEFFIKGKLLGELNSTLITLVPKVSTPNKVYDFRPISCCNVVYKCIKLLKGYDCIRGPKRCSMKIDIQKACDTMNCDRGLRQGDPMSPYLFTLVMKVLILHHEIMRNASFKYHHGCKELDITHLCFADDLLVLCHGDVDSVRVIKKSLEKFSVVSGLNALERFHVECGELQKGKAKVARKGLLKRTLSGSISTVNLKKGVFVRWISNNDNWIWNNVLDLRSVVRMNMIYKIGNGRKVSLWHDRWSDKLTLDFILSRREVYSAGFSNIETVCGCINGNRWRWPNEWFLKYPILSQIHVPNLNNEIEDKLLWRTNNGILKAFSSNQVWKDIRILNGHVQWPWEFNLHEKSAEVEIESTDIVSDVGLLTTCC
nr:hypothetical protein [Tanacetum cinerariifolium]